MQLNKDQLAFFEEHGFLLLENYFSIAETELLISEFGRVSSVDTPHKILEKNGAVRTIFAAHLTSEVFRRLSRLPRLVRPASQILRSDVYIHQYKINAKVALEGDQWEWHQDFLYWHKEDGMPTPRVLTAVLFLQEANEFNGPLLVIPGSHKHGMIPIMQYQKPPAAEAMFIAEPEDVPAWLSTLTADLKYKIDKDIMARLLRRASIFPIKCGVGSCLFFHGNLFHASATNLSAEDRTSVFISYNSVENRLPDIASPRPTFIAERDFSPVEPLPDGSLLENGKKHL